MTSTFDTPVHTAEQLNQLAGQGYIFDHPYWGNMCSGFGGTLECKHVDPFTRESCRKDPYLHLHLQPKRSRGWLWVDLTKTPEDYEPRHRLGEMLGVDGFVQVGHRGRKVRCLVPECGRVCVLLEEDLLASLPEHHWVDLPCGCKTFAYILRQEWGVENRSGDPR